MTRSEDEPSDDDVSTDAGATSPNVAGGQGDSEDAKTERAGRRISLSLRLRTAGVIFLCVVLLVSAGVMTWLYLGERSRVKSHQRQDASDRRAEQIALDYAIGAATMNFQDLNAWKTQLVKGTTPTLKEKLDRAATQMQQILVPLEWNSTAQPLAAKVRSDAGGIYVVDTFVSVRTKTTQAPDNLQSTATYSITIDSNDNWLIGDVGGIGAVVGPQK